MFTSVFETIDLVKHVGLLFILNVALIVLAITLLLPTTPDSPISTCFVFRLLRVFCVSLDTKPIRLSLTLNVVIIVIILTSIFKFFSKYIEWVS